jgi:hypothetical protein
MKPIEEVNVRNCPSALRSNTELRPSKNTCQQIFKEIRDNCSKSQHKLAEIIYGNVTASDGELMAASLHRSVGRDHISACGLDAEWSLETHGK